MSNKILVTYASRTGTTASVADAIARTLSQGGAAVEVMPMERVQDLAPYGAVVAGSAIRKSKWLPEAVKFVESHRLDLQGKRFAMFTVCITIAMSNTLQYRSTVAGWVAPVRALVTPLSEGFFPGMLDFDKLPMNWDTLMLRMTVMAGIFPKGDCRDWNAVHEWATDLNSILVF